MSYWWWIIIVMKIDDKLKRITDLVKLYGTSDSDRLVQLMKKDIRMIDKMSITESDRELKSELGYSRIGSNNI